MNNMKYIIFSYAAILLLGTMSLFTGIHHFANVAGFFSALGFMAVFFKDRDDEKEFSELELAAAKKLRKYWYITFSTGIFFSLILGTFWNHHMGNMT